MSANLEPEMIDSFIDRDFDLPFKGNRSYIHSTDIFDACTAQIANSTYAEDMEVLFVFRSLLSSRMRLVLPERGDTVSFSEDKAADIFGDIVLKSSMGRRVGFLVRDKREVTQRRQDLSAKLEAETIFDDDGIHLAQRNPQLTPIETAVALTKILHVSTISNQVKWLATRLQFPLKFSQMQYESMSVRIERNANDKATSSTVSCDGQPVGRVMFNAVPLKET